MKAYGITASVVGVTLLNFYYISETSVVSSHPFKVCVTIRWYQSQYQYRYQYRN